MNYNFKSTNQRLFNKRIFGFDIETHDKNKKFTMASIVGYDRYKRKYEKTFLDKDELIFELKNNLLYRNSIIFATNLGFDFFGTFFDTSEAGKFRLMMRGSNLLGSKTYIKNNEFSFCGKRESNTKRYYPSLQFLDSMNYAKLSVKKMGDVLGLEKLTSPDFSEFPQTPEELEYMKKYNLRDAWITHDFMRFFINTIEKIGASFKMTIASTSMSLFKNKYLGDYQVYPNDINILRELFEGYYGGRTETFKRGTFHNANYYDFNSLYPSVMYDYEYPDPNSQRISHDNTLDCIKHFEGVSKVRIEIPYSHIPLLPYRHDNKIIFPYGTLEGSWSHLELRKAIEEGATIIKVYKSIYYKEKIRPFKKFVEDMYSMRMNFKSQNNPMELIVKLFMNALYGKFGEKFDDKGSVVHQDAVTLEMLDKAIKVDVLGDYYLLGENRRPKNHCIPIWAIYVTAYGRLKLYESLKEHNPIYCDTDSIITYDTITTSNAMGDLKLEMRVDEGITVRPKFYALSSLSGNIVKIKGLAKRLTVEQFKELKTNPKIPYYRMATFKEAMRRGFVVNEIFETSKEFSLNDEKRSWSNTDFIWEQLEDSQPLHIVPNLNASNSPMMSSGANNKGEVAPIKKYENINIIEPNTPMIELV